jgi:hypothetical protein
MSYEADQLRAELAKERSLWHCTMEDKAAMDANLLAVERERDLLRTRVMIAGAILQDYLKYKRDSLAREAALEILQGDEDAG